MQNKKTYTSTLVIAAIFFVILFVITFAMIRNLSQQTRTEALKSKLTPTPKQEKIAVILKTDDNQRIFLRGEEVNVTAYAQIPIGKRLTGFDLVIYFDKNKATLRTSQGLLSDFKTFIREQDGRIDVSGVKDPAITVPVATVDQIPLAQLVFRPTSEGPLNLKVEFVPGGTTKDTNLIGESGKDILTAISVASVEIGRSITLVKGQHAFLDSGKTIISLDQITAQAPGCVDCLDYAKVSVKSGGTEKSAEFKIGGIAGMNDIYKEVLGFGFEVVELRPNSITLRTAKL